MSFDFSTYNTVFPSSDIGESVKLRLCHLLHLLAHQLCLSFRYLFFSCSFIDFAGPQHDLSVTPDTRLTTEQANALEVVLTGRNLFITGVAGTGKSFLLHRVVRGLANHGLRIAVTVCASPCAFPYLNCVALVGERVCRFICQKTSVSFAFCPRYIVFSLF